MMVKTTCGHSLPDTIGCGISLYKLLTALCTLLLRAKEDTSSSVEFLNYMNHSPMSEAANFIITEHFLVPSLRLFYAELLQIFTDSRKYTEILLQRHLMKATGSDLDIKWQHSPQAESLHAAQGIILTSLKEAKSISWSHLEGITW